MRIQRMTGVITGVALVFGTLVTSHSDNLQPIQYNHALHVGELSIGCLDCHTTAETGIRASIPNIDLCGACHVDTEAENPRSRAVSQYSEKGERIPWQQVHVIPDYVYFSHRRHVKLGEVQCESCHGAVSQMQAPFLKPFVSMNMAWCLGCHEQRGISGDCYLCHR